MYCIKAYSEKKEKKNIGKIFSRFCPLTRNNLYKGFGEEAFSAIHSSAPPFIIYVSRNQDPVSLLEGQVPLCLLCEVIQCHSPLFTIRFSLKRYIRHLIDRTLHFTLQHFMVHFDLKTWGYDTNVQNVQNIDEYLRHQSGLILVA